MTPSQLYEIKKAYIAKHKYTMTRWDRYDYSFLGKNIMWRKKAGARSGTYNDVIIMFDTETSKSGQKGIHENHVCAWTLSVRAYGYNIVTLYGTRPSECVKAIEKINDQLEGEDTYFYAHNLSYDWWHLRRFFLQHFGHPTKQINTKPHYPIYIKFGNGVILKDSLILAQRKLEKWAIDMDVEHKKAVGFWDYDKVRNQGERFNKNELIYIENDTLAGVECIDATMQSLGKSIYSIPLTATGIPRGRVAELAKDAHFKEKFLKMAPTYEQYEFLLNVFHGGYTHGNRHFIEIIIRDLVQAYDFSSSYPFVMLARKYPCERFTPEDNMLLSEIVEDAEENAYMFKLVARGVKLKDYKHPMPYLQYSKCLDSENVVTDNGRILKADYVEICLNEIDAKIIYDQYEFTEGHICVEVQQASKDYLPRWFTDYIYECYHDNKMWKGIDPVNYSITKSTTNSLYGMTVQRALRNEIEEYYTSGTTQDGEEYISGDYHVVKMENPEEEYEKYLNKYNKVLPYFYGVWVTAYAVENLFRLGSMCDVWLYSDTDSVYGVGWDKKKIDCYNKECEQILTERGYAPFTNKKGRKFVLGAAELDGEYTEYRYTGAKRYCGRSKEDGELHITVAGVPKKGVACLKDDIKNFKTGMIFDGKTTGKLTHTYFFADIHSDENGNEIGDSIDLSPCDYLLSAVTLNDILEEEVQIPFFDYSEV